jgi:hypothetical protein
MHGRDWKVIGYVWKLVFRQELLLTYWQKFKVFHIMTLGMYL